MRSIRLAPVLTNGENVAKHTDKNWYADITISGDSKILSGNLLVLQTYLVGFHLSKCLGIKYRVGLVTPDREIFRKLIEYCLNNLYIRRNYKA